MTLTRRDMLRKAALAVPLATLPVGAGDAQDDEAGRKIKQAVDKGVKFLLGNQKKDGAIHDNRYITSMTSLSIMALAAVGHQPTDGNREGKAMSRALEYVLKPERQEKDGYYGKKDGSRMYGHGIITLMLAEMLGMGVNEEQEKVIRERLEKAVDLILQSQRVRKNNDRFKGGWRYEPSASDADMSVTGWQLIALRAAKNAGIKVPGESIEMAMQYVRRSMGDGRGKKNSKGDYFRYQPGSGGFRFGSATAGLLVLQICGDYESDEVRAASDYLLHYKIHHGLDHFYYGIYYYSQGMYQRKGKYAEHARKTVAELLGKLQKGDGSWHASHGKVYATAMALLSLSVYYHYLPIYQR